MAAERVRVFVGVNELEATSTRYINNNDAIINSAEISVKPTNNVAISNTVNVTKADGSTNVFSGRVVSIQEPNVWILNVLTNGYELVDKYMEKTYTATSPEAIVQDVVNNFTNNLTYIGTQSSGITIDYTAKGYLIDIIKDMMTVLRWRTVIDETDQVDFGPEGSTDNGVTLTNGSNFVVESWESTEDTIINSVRIYGGFESINTEETVSGTGTTFSLTYKPSGSLRVLVSGSEVSPSEFSVKAEDKQIVFTSSKTNPTFQYTYNRPIVVEDKNDTSVSTRGEKFRELQAPYYTTTSDVRRFARSVVNEFSSLGVLIGGYVPFLNFDLNVNEAVTVVDSLRVKNARGVIRSIEYDYDNGRTILTIGPRIFDMVDWRSKVQDRIKQLERRFVTEEQPYFVRSDKTKINVGVLNKSNRRTIKSPTDSFILGHATLGRLRADLNTEADCSNTGNTGTWNGTGLSGSQYSTSGFRLSCGIFNGSDNYISTSASESGIQSAVFIVNSDTNNRGLFQLASGVSVSIDSSGDISTTGLTNATVYVDNVATTTVGTGAFKVVIITFDSQTCDDIEVGRVSSSYFDGSGDEFMLFNIKLDSTQRASIQNKTFYSNSSFYSNCKLWWSMDNPKLGERLTTISTITWDKDGDEV